jgi:putative FmdB family regulatory protein
MPVYEYYCAICKKEFELRRSMSEADQPGTCPTCGGKADKLVSAAASKVDFYVRPPARGAFRKPAAKPSKT